MTTDTVTPYADVLKRVDEAAAICAAAPPLDLNADISVPETDDAMLAKLNTLSEVKTLLKQVTMLAMGAHLQKLDRENEEEVRHTMELWDNIGFAMDMALQTVDTIAHNVIDRFIAAKVAASGEVTIN